MDADKNVSVTGVDGKAAISNASGSYKIEGDYEYVADVTKRAPQFDLEYTYESGQILSCSRKIGSTSGSA